MGRGAIRTMSRGERMRLIDLSQPIFHDSPNCPAHPPVRAEILRTIPNRAGRRTPHHREPHRFPRRCPAAQD